MKTLKLAGLQTYISPFTKFNVLRAGAVIVVDDALAVRLLEGGEHHRDRGFVKHWEEVPKGTRADFDFSTGKDVAPVEAEAPAEPTADELEAAARVAAAEAEAHAEEVALRLASQAEADKLNPPPPVPAVAPVPKGQRVARKPAASK